MKLIYVFDAYCGWSHGLSRTMSEVTARHPDLPVEVVSGGLFTGGRRQPIRAFGFVSAANATITERTGAEFGDAYQQRLADGSFVMDSEADAVVDAFQSPAAQAAAEADFRRAAELGVEAYPTLLAIAGGHVIPLAHGHATTDQIDQRLTTAVAIPTA